VENDFRKDFWSDDEEHAAQTEVLKQLTPLKSFASVNDVVNAIIFLLSDKASMITGLNLMIDGGFSAR
jgi:L-xylulose reductase